MKKKIYFKIPINSSHEFHFGPNMYANSCAHCMRISEAMTYKRPINWRFFFVLASIIHSIAYLYLAKPRYHWVSPRSSCSLYIFFFLFFFISFGDVCCCACCFSFSRILHLLLRIHRIYAKCMQCYNELTILIHFN